MNGGKSISGDFQKISKPRVGFFDSGIGGVSIAKAFLALRPEADILYTADWTYCPYGTRAESEVMERAHTLTKELVRQGCRIVVLACNTASAVALQKLREMYPDIRFVGMEPAVKPAAKQSRTGVIGVLATGPTLRGGLLSKTASRYANHVRILRAEGTGFVELVESGKIDTPEATQTVRRVLAPMLEAGCDVIVLGCTHFPFLLPVFRRIAPNVLFLDPANAVARQVATLYDELLWQKPQS
ncbi:MAG: glutamate racemase [Kiritimatiellia bacterium]